MWAIQVCAAVKGIVFSLLQDSVYNSERLGLEQGINFPETDQLVEDFIQTRDCGIRVPAAHPHKQIPKVPPPPPPPHPRACSTACPQNRNPISSFSGTDCPRILSPESVDYLGTTDHFSGRKKKRIIFKISKTSRFTAKSGSRNQGSRIG